MPTIFVQILLCLLVGIFSFCNQDNQTEPQQSIPHAIETIPIHAYPTTTITGYEIINRYAGLAQDVQMGDTIIPILPETLEFYPKTWAPSWRDVPQGALLLIWQVQGATMKTTNDASYGQILDENQAGLFEYAILQEIDFDHHTLKLQQGLQHSYQAKNHIQIVMVPRYEALNLMESAFITAPSWDGTIGGIVALQAWRILLNGTIDTTGKGFRGGRMKSVGPNDPTIKADGYVYENEFGAEKGESIAGFTKEYQTMGGSLGRGAPANGGGGGNAYQSGGGGGANGDNLIPWTGLGFLDSTKINWNIWCLDQSIWGGATCLRNVNSSGGGRGGYSYSLAILDPSIIAPESAAWAGNQRRAQGGLGGHPIPEPMEKRLFFGGGGGCGHYQGPDQGDTYPGRGGAGGGVIFITADQMIGKGKLVSDGQPGNDTSISGNPQIIELQYAGAGGGGGGGSILLEAQRVIPLSEGFPPGILLSAQGGPGGNQLFDNTMVAASGPGGGGGGGSITIPQEALVRTPILINGGSSGMTHSVTMSKFPENGATFGGIGKIKRVPFSSNLQFDMKPLPQKLLPAPLGTFRYQLLIENKGTTFVRQAILQLTSNQLVQYAQIYCQTNDPILTYCPQMNRSNFMEVFLPPLSKINWMLLFPFQKNQGANQSHFKQI